MTAHVAERGEGRGRVVVGVSCGDPVPQNGLRAALRVAQAYHAEIEGLLIEDRQLYDVGEFPFSREISMTGGVGNPIVVAEIRRDMRLAARRAERELGALSREADVPLSCRHVAEAPVHAIAEACQAMGPWNVVALTRPMCARSLAGMGRFFERVTGMTGVVMAAAGGYARRRVATQQGGRQGAVVAVVEDIDRLAGMLRTAERLARVDASEVVVAIAATRRTGLQALERDVRASVNGAGPAVVTLGRPGGGPAVVAEALRRLSPGFVVAVHGGLVAPASGVPGPLGDILLCPLLLVR